MSSKKSLKQRNELSFEWRIVSAFDGMSLKQIAEKLQINDKTFWNWAMQRTQMPNEVLAKIGKETGISLNWLLTGEGERLTADKKDFTTLELVEKVNEKSEFFSLELFVYEFAKINPHFHKMLNDIAYKNAEKIALSLQQIFDEWDDEYEEKRKVMYDYINSKPELVRELRKSSRKTLNWKIAEPNSPQELGNIDEFNVEEAVEKYPNVNYVLIEWYKHEGITDLSSDFGFIFSNWDTMTFEDKVKTVKLCKELADKDIKQ